MKNNIVYITDEKYVMPTCVSITSLFRNNVKKQEYRIYVLMDHVSDTARARLELLNDRYAECILMEINSDKYIQEMKARSQVYSHVTNAAMCKFEIAEILHDADKALYLDGDVLIHRDISELFEIDLSDYCVAAADDMGDCIDEYGKSGLAQRIGMHTRYFNSGVMLLNLERWRREYVKEKLIKYRFEEVNYFMDQDALNAVLGNKRLCLPGRYNFRVALFDSMLFEEVNESFCNNQYSSVDECLDDQSLLHMTDWRKPWEYNMPWISERFLAYYRQSPYKTCPLRLLSPVKQADDKTKEIRVSWEQISNDCRKLNDEYRKLHDRFILATRDIRKIWMFPYYKVQKNSKVVLYGAGDVGRDMCRQIRATNYCDMVLWVDKNWTAMEEEQIADPEIIRNLTYDYVIIAISKDKTVQEVYQYLKSIGVMENKIVKMDQYEEY